MPRAAEPCLEERKPTGKRRKAEGLGEALKWEASRGGALFPHLYRPLLISEVLSEAALSLDADGVPRLGDHLA